MVLRPVGAVKRSSDEPSVVASQDSLHGKERAAAKRSVVSKIRIDEAFTGILDGIEAFSHLLVLYWAHRVSEEARSLIKVHPMGRKDLPLVGIFATHSPVRPNPICATVVELLERNGDLLTVRGLDALDGSPIIDIKPYNPTSYPVGEVRIPRWLEHSRRGPAVGSTADTTDEENGGSAG